MSGHTHNKSGKSKGWVPRSGGKSGSQTPKAQHGSKGFKGGSNVHMGGSRVGGNANNTGKKRG